MAGNLKKLKELVNRRIGQKVKQGERDTARRFAHVLTEIRVILGKYYEKYEQGGTLTREEMLKFDRLQKMQKEIEHVLRTHYTDLFKRIVEILFDIYGEGYKLTAWAVETDARARLNYSTATGAAMTQMLEAPINGLTLNQRLERRRTDIIYAIQQEITAGLERGETYGTMAKRIKGALEDNALKAIRIVRTEAHRYQEKSKTDAVEHANKQGVITVKVWNSMEDERVRNGKVRGKANHRKLDGKKLRMDQNFDDGLSKGKGPGMMGAAGSDINCRCFLTYEIVRVEKPPAPELEDMTLEVWEKERLRAA